MRAIVISVNPPHAGNLVDGLKTIEWRKKPLPECTAYVYETKRNGGCGKVIGEVRIVGDTKCDTNEWWSTDFDLIVRGKVGVRFLEKYAAKNDGVIYANECRDAVRYDIPKELSEFETTIVIPEGTQWFGNMYSYKHIFNKKLTRPPVSWCYVEV